MLLNQQSSENNNNNSKPQLQNSFNSSSSLIMCPTTPHTQQLAATPSSRLSSSSISVATSTTTTTATTMSPRSTFRKRPVRPRSFQTSSAVENHQRKNSDSIFTWTRRKDSSPGSKSTSLSNLSSDTSNMNDASSFFANQDNATTTTEDATSCPRLSQKAASLLQRNSNSHSSSFASSLPGGARKDAMLQNLEQQKQQLLARGDHKAQAVLQWTRERHHSNSNSNNHTGSASKLSKSSSNINMIPNNNNNNSMSNLNHNPGGTQSLSLSNLNIASLTSPTKSSSTAGPTKTTNNDHSRSPSPGSRRRLVLERSREPISTDSNDVFHWSRRSGEDNHDQHGAIGLNSRLPSPTVTATTAASSTAASSSSISVMQPPSQTTTTSSNNTAATGVFHWTREDRSSSVPSTPLTYHKKQQNSEDRSRMTSSSNNSFSNLAMIPNTNSPTTGSPRSYHKKTLSSNIRGHGEWHASAEFGPSTDDGEAFAPFAASFNKHEQQQPQPQQQQDLPPTKHEMLQMLQQASQDCALLVPSQRHQRSPPKRSHSSSALQASLSSSQSAANGFATQPACESVSTSSTCVHEALSPLRLVRREKSSPGSSGKHPLPLLPLSSLPTKAPLVVLDDHYDPYDDDPFQGSGATLSYTNHSASERSNTNIDSRPPKRDRAFDRWDLSGEGGENDEDETEHNDDYEVPWNNTKSKVNQPTARESLTTGTQNKHLHVSQSSFGSKTSFDRWEIVSAMSIASEHSDAAASTNTWKTNPDAFPETGKSQQQSKVGAMEAGVEAGLEAMMQLVPPQRTVKKESQDDMLFLGRFAPTRTGSNNKECRLSHTSGGGLERAPPRRTLSASRSISGSVTGSHMSCESSSDATPIWSVPRRTNSAVSCSSNSGVYDDEERTQRRLPQEARRSGSCSTGGTHDGVSYSDHRPSATNTAITRQWRSPRRSNSSRSASSSGSGSGDGMLQRRETTENIVPMQDMLRQDNKYDKDSLKLSSPRRPGQSRNSSNESVLSAVEEVSEHLAAPGSARFATDDCPNLKKQSGQGRRPSLESPSKASHKVHYREGCEADADMLNRTGHGQVRATETLDKSPIKNRTKRRPSLKTDAEAIELSMRNEDATALASSTAFRQRSPGKTRAKERPSLLGSGENDNKIGEQQNIQTKAIASASNVQKDRPSSRTRSRRRSSSGGGGEKCGETNEHQVRPPEEGEERGFPKERAPSNPRARRRSSGLAACGHSDELAAVQIELRDTVNSSVDSDLQRSPSKMGANRRLSSRGESVNFTDIDGPVRVAPSQSQVPDCQEEAPQTSKKSPRIKSTTAESSQNSRPKKEETYLGSGLPFVPSLSKHSRVGFESDLEDEDHAQKSHNKTLNNTLNDCLKPPRSPQLKRPLSPKSCSPSSSPIRQQQDNHRHQRRWSAAAGCDELSVRNPAAEPVRRSRRHSLSTSATTTTGFLPHMMQAKGIGNSSGADKNISSDVDRVTNVARAKSGLKRNSSPETLARTEQPLWNEEVKLPDSVEQKREISHSHSTLDTSATSETRKWSNAVMPRQHGDHRSSKGLQNHTGSFSSTHDFVANSPHDEAEEGDTTGGAIGSLKVVTDAADPVLRRVETSLPPSREQCQSNPLDKHLNVENAIAADGMGRNVSKLETARLPETEFSSSANDDGAESVSLSPEMIFAMKSTSELECGESYAPVVEQKEPMQKQKKSTSQGRSRKRTSTGGASSSPRRESRRSTASTSPKRDASRKRAPHSRRHSAVSSSSMSTQPRTTTVVSEELVACQGAEVFPQSDRGNDPSAAMTSGNKGSKDLTQAQLQTDKSKARKPRERRLSMTSNEARRQMDDGGGIPIARRQSGCDEKHPKELLRVGASKVLTLDNPGKRPPAPGTQSANRLSVDSEQGQDIVPSKRNSRQRRLSITSKDDRGNVDDVPSTLTWRSLSDENEKHEAGTVASRQTSPRRPRRTGRRLPMTSTVEKSASMSPVERSKSNSLSPRTVAGAGKHPVETLSAKKPKESDSHSGQNVGVAHDLSAAPSAMKGTLERTRQCSQKEADELVLPQSKPETGTGRSVQSVASLPVVRWSRVQRRAAASVDKRNELPSMDSTRRLRAVKLESDEDEISFETFAQETATTSRSKANSKTVDDDDEKSYATFAQETVATHFIKSIADDERSVISKSLSKTVAAVKSAASFAQEKFMTNTSRLASENAEESVKEQSNDTEATDLPAKLSRRWSLTAATSSRSPSSETEKPETKGGAGRRFSLSLSSRTPPDLQGPHESKDSMSQSSAKRVESIRLDKRIASIRLDGKVLDAPFSNKRIESIRLDGCTPQVQRIESIRLDGDVTQQQISNTRIDSIRLDGKLHQHIIPATQNVRAKSERGRRYSLTLASRTPSDLQNMLTMHESGQDLNFRPDSIHLQREAQENNGNFEDTLSCESCRQSNADNGKRFSLTLASRTPSDLQQMLQSFDDKGPNGTSMSAKRSSAAKSVSLATRSPAELEVMLRSYDPALWDPAAQKRRPQTGRDTPLRRSPSRTRRTAGSRKASDERSVVSVGRRTSRAAPSAVRNANVEKLLEVKKPALPTNSHQFPASSKSGPENAKGTSGQSMDESHRSRARSMQNRRRSFAGVPNRSNEDHSTVVEHSRRHSLATEGSANLGDFVGSKHTRTGSTAAHHENCDLSEPKGVDEKSRCSSRGHASESSRASQGASSACSDNNIERQARQQSPSSSGSSPNKDDRSRSLAGQATKLRSRSRINRRGASVNRKTKPAESTNRLQTEPSSIEEVAPDNAVVSTLTDEPPIFTEDTQGNVDVQDLSKTGKRWSISGALPRFRPFGNPKGIEGPREESGTFPDKNHG